MLALNHILYLLQLPNRNAGLQQGALHLILELLHQRRPLLELCLQLLHLLLSGSELLLPCRVGVMQLLCLPCRCLPQALHMLVLLQEQLQLLVKRARCLPERRYRRALRLELVGQPSDICLHLAPPLQRLRH